MKCLNCDQDNIDLARFCSQCGSPLQQSTEPDIEAIKAGPEFNELIDKKDKLFFIMSIAGGSILVFVGFLLSHNLLFTDPLLSDVLLFLTIIVIAYIFVVSIILVLRKVLQYIKPGKSIMPDDVTVAGILSTDGLITSQEQQRERHLRQRSSRLRFGGAFFAALIIVAVIIAIILPRPQYMFTGLTITREFVHGEQSFVVADVENYGRAGGSLLLTLLIDDKEVQSETVYLEAGNKKSFQITLLGDYRPGTYDVMMGVGDSKQIDYNYSGQLRILTPPEFTIRSLKVDPNRFDYTDIKDTVIKVEVANIGEAAGQDTLEIFVDGNLEHKSDLSLGGGLSKKIDVPLEVAGPGSYSVSIDDTSEILEVFNIEQPQNGSVLMNKISGGDGHLKVVNNEDVDLALIFVKSAEPQNSLLAVYMRANSSTTVRGIRDGDYLVYYSTGLYWDSHSKRFTQFADHGRYEDPFNYSTSHRADETIYTIWECEFGSADPDAAVSVHYVNPDKFPVISN